MVNLHPGQSAVYSDLFLEKKIRFAAVRCARGWGKSYMAAVSSSSAVFELMEMDWSVPNKNVFIIAPTYTQVTDIYYPILAYDLGMESFAISSSRDLGRFIFPNKVELRLLSYEAVERMRGKGFYFGTWDEICSCSKGITAKEAWEGVIQPTIITRWSKERAKRFGAPSPGRALIITTPKGKDYFYDLYYMYEADPSWGSYHYDYTESPFIDAEEIERIKHTIDPVEFASEYLASFEDSGNNVFYCFDRRIHVRNDIPYFYPPEGDEKGEDVHCAIDFNVGIQATSFFAHRGNQLHFLDELKGHPDTETLAITIRDTFKGHNIYAYPDPSGKARKTSAPVGVTDFSILEKYGIRCRARKKAPPISDSVQAVNQKLMTAAGDVSIFIDNKCTNLIHSMERTKWMDKNPDNAAIDKSDGFEHFSDGVRYAVEYLYPVQRGTKIVSRGFNF